MKNESNDPISNRLKEIEKGFEDGSIADPENRFFDPDRKNPVPSKPDPMPGQQRVFTGREGVPQLHPGHIRGLRDRIDPNDPVTLPGKVITTKKESKP